MRAILLDINVVLDVFLNRDQWLTDSAGVLQANHEGRVTAHLAAISLPTIFYIVRRNSDLAKAHRTVQECLASFQIVPVDRTTLELAASLTGSDFEDNVQIACAILSRQTAIVTRDPGGFSGSAVPVLTPGELLTQLANQQPESP